MPEKSQSKPTILSLKSKLYRWLFSFLCLSTIQHMSHMYTTIEARSKHTSCGTEAGDQRGGEWEPIKISLKFESSAYIPKPPQTLEPRSARIAMNKLSRSKRPESQSGSKSERTSQIESAQAQTGLTGIEDRSDRSRSSRTDRPVWPVSPTGLTGGVQKTPKIQFQNRESRANHVQIGWNLEDSFVPTPRVYPQEISP